MAGHVGLTSHASPYPSHQRYLSWSSIGWRGRSRPTGCSGRCHPWAPSPASVDALRGQGYGWRPPRLRAAFALPRPPPRLWRCGAIMETRGLLPQHKHGLPAHAVQRRWLVARQHRRQATPRMIQKVRRGHRLGPAVAGTWHTADRLCAQPHSKLRQALGMSGIVHRTRRHCCRYPMAHRPIPPRDT